MARTYWEKKENGTLEFLGAFRDGHQVKDPKSQQARGAIIDIIDLGIQDVHEKLQMETRAAPPVLSGLPSSIGRRLSAMMPVSLPWAQIEGLVR